MRPPALAFLVAACATPILVRHPLANSESDVRCDPSIGLPSLADQNRRLVRQTAKIIGKLMYSQPVSVPCDASAKHPASDLYGTAMRLECPRGTLCSNGEDVRPWTTDDACEESMMVLGAGWVFPQAMVPRDANRFIEVESIMCGGETTPEDAIVRYFAAKLRANPSDKKNAAVLVKLTCDEENDCAYEMLGSPSERLGGHARRVDDRWSVSP
jgi:hypothetical protein